MTNKLIQEAKSILESNFHKNGFTIPSQGLYPCQWNWDSGFVAIGLAYYNMKNAQLEVQTLLDTQWGNGLIPHIIFHIEQDTYFPDAAFHDSKRHPLASKKHKSSGMTQPPILGFVLKEMLRIADNKDDMISFIKKNIDKVYKCHSYLYTNRDINDEGLVYIYHNWESGTDNSPVWDDIWKTMDPPKYSFERRDTTQVDHSMRPSKREYDYYMYLIDMAKGFNYNDGKIAQNSPFLVQDPLFNAMLVKSNSALIELYKMIGGNQGKILQLEKWQAKSLQGFNKLYDDDLGAYIYYDLKNDKPIRQISSSSFAPVYADIPNEAQAERLVQTMLDKFGGSDRYLCASFNPTSDRFDPRRYWRGPVWININWMLYQGFNKYGYKDVAQRIKKDSIELVEIDGFHENFDSRKEIRKSMAGGCGGSGFSWSAALVLDMLNR